jgi:hypothetical protein
MAVFHSKSVDFYDLPSIASYSRDIMNEKFSKLKRGNEKH